MNCNNFSENIFAYLENDLPPLKAEEFKLHLSKCVSCQKLYDNVTGTYKIIDIEKDIPDNPFFYHKLITRLSATKQEQTITVIMNVLKPLAVAASIALGIIIGNGELDILSNNDENIDLAAENISLVMPADYSVWSTINEGNGSEN